MRRRLFVVLFASALAWSATASTQAHGRVYRVGVLFPASEVPGARILIETMAKRGFAEGRDITFDFRSAKGDPDRLPQLARELVAMRPDVIVSSTEPAIRALAAATGDIPVVLAGVGDPVRLGITKSLARPSGNMTGFITGFDTVGAKRLQLLLEVVPGARKVAVLWVAGNKHNRGFLELLRRAASEFKIELVSLPVIDETGIAAAITKAESEGARALVIAGEPMTVRNRRSIIDECLMRNLPAIHNFSFEVRDGALMSYGGEVGEDYRRSADYIERILKGAKVAELPFQQPTHFTLAINLRTARELRLTVPPSLLLRADELIE
jgi:ABC-type uncharacterized transport system substrate-binding protein